MIGTAYLSTASDTTTTVYHNEDVVWFLLDPNDPLDIDMLWYFTLIEENV